MRTKIDIRRAITERGYTITSFCQKFDLKTQNIIQNYIKGNPTIKRLEDLCEKLDCDITDLFYPIDDSDDAKKNVLLFNKEKEEEKDSDSSDTDVLDINDTAIQLPDTQPTIKTTTFCPHCGAKVRVGVVLLPEE
nr:MAG TPA: Cro/C1-type HTH DNA-binding domain protein [Caudoviricetes sp.]